MEKMLKYPLFKDVYINRWYVSSIRSEALSFEPVNLEGDMNLWLKEGLSLYENPCKTRFVEERRRRVIQPADKLDDYSKGKAVWDGQSQELDLYNPYNDMNVTLSGFWYEPTHISCWATNYLLATKAYTGSFEVTTCGGISIWVNGLKVDDFTPFTRNEEQKTIIRVPIQEGYNRVDIYLDDLAERDTDFTFRLKHLSREPLVQCLILKEAEPEKVLLLEKAVSDMAFMKNTYTSGDVDIYFNNPLSEEVHMMFTGATEENANSGVFFKRCLQISHGESNIILGNCQDLPFGFLEFHIGISYKDLCISRRLTVENFPLEKLPASSETLEERKRQIISFLAEHGEDNLNRGVALLHDGGDKKEIKKIIDRQLKTINARYDCSDFYLVYFPHIISAFSENDLICQETLDEMKSCILNFRYWIDEPGDDVMWFFSENHALMFHACQLLCGELYPDEMFSSSGLMGREMQEKAKTLLIKWFSNFFKEGLTEWNSSAYLPINALGLGNLYAQTQDDEIRELSRKALDSIFFMLAVNSGNGYLASSSGRTYLKELMGNYSNGTTSMSYMAFGTGNINQAAKGVLSLCISDYTPPKAYMDFQRIKEDQALTYQATQGIDGFVDIYTYKTQHYMLTSSPNFKSGKKGYQENPIHLYFKPEAQIWVNHPGEWAEIGSGRPSYWAGNGILPKVDQYRGFASVIYDIPEENLIDFTHLYLPSMAFDQVIYEKHWVFAVVGQSYAGVYCSQELKRQITGCNRNREILAHGRKCIWFIRGVDKSEFDSFEDFVKVMKEASIEIFDMAYTFDDPLLGKLAAGKEQVLSVEGQQMEYTGFTMEGNVEIENTESFLDKGREKDAE